MYEIQQVTSDPKQKRILVLADGSQMELSIHFSPLQQGWFITSLSYQGFVLNGFRISNNPNMLFQWKNKLTFGIACFSKNDREPSLQEDFSSGASSLYILSQEEVDAYSELLSA